MPAFFKDRRVLIVGLGLMGGSYAQALSREGVFTGGIDPNIANLEYALNNGIIADGRLEPEEEFVRSFDTVVFALYPHVFVDWVKRWQHMLAPGALVSDVTGVKSGLLEQLLPVLRSDIRFVPAHPMAGREGGGIQMSDCSVFRGANFIITPVSGTDPAAASELEDMARLMGFGRVSFLSPGQHDEMIAFLSQLTHCIAVALMVCKDSAHLVDYSGDSFRDLTRIARINENMWTELFLSNREALLREMDLFSEKFSRLREAIADGDAEGLKEMMRLSTLRRALFDVK